MEPVVWTVSVEPNVLLECLEFTCMVAPHVYPRLTQSRQSFSTHMARTFFGKVGESALATLMIRDQWADAQQVYDTMFRVFPGTTAVDDADLISDGVRLDVKTVFLPQQHYLIVPRDQWDHQPKDAYVLVRTTYPDANPWQTMTAFFDRQRASFTSIQAMGQRISLDVRRGRAPDHLALHDLNLRLRQIFHETPLPWTEPVYATLVGFLPAKNSRWVMVQQDRICSECPCVRCRDTDLMPIDRLAVRLKAQPHFAS